MSVIDHVQIKIVPPKKPKGIPALARAGARLIENANPFTYPVELLQLGVAWINEARAINPLVVSWEQLARLGYHLFGTPYVEAHQVALEWHELVIDHDPKALERVIQEIEAEAKSFDDRKLHDVLRPRGNPPGDRGQG